jgi:hypothetical protein
MNLIARARVAAAACAVALVGLTAPPAFAVDTTPPQVNLNGGLFFKVGSVLSDSTTSPTIPANVTWGTFDDVGVTRQTGYFYANGASYSPSLSPSARQWALPNVRLGASGSSPYVEADIYAYDGAGNYGYDYDYYYSNLIQQGAMTASAGWSTAACNCWSAGSVLKSARAGASLQYQFTGNSVAVVSDKAAGRGNMQVYIDGRLQATVSTAGATTNRVVVYQKRFNASQTHTIKLVAESSARIDVDGLIIQN